MKKRAYIVTLALLVALMAASGASAKKMARHSISKQAERHMLVRRAPEARAAVKAPAYRQYRRAGRNSF